MNTPAHGVINLIILGRKERPEITVPILVGSVLPDAPMVCFYLYVKLLLGMPEALIWSQAYYEASWQAFFDLFNSIPLTVFCMLLAHRLGAVRLGSLSASMALHAFGDLLLHNEDAHRHFFPFLDWRFRSPISYWDPRHYGNVFAPLEAVAVVVGLIVLTRRYTSTVARALTILVIVVYALYWIYALWVWA